MDAGERRRLALEALGVTEAPARSPRPQRVRESERPDQRKRVFFSCDKKRRYKTEHDATCASHRVFKERGTRLRVYYCNYCRGWHLTKHVNRGDGA